MRTLKSVMALFGSLALLLGMCVLGAATASAADVVDPGTAPPLRFSTFNMCGHKCVAVDKLTDDAYREDVVVRETDLTGWKADQIFLQEVCAYQYDAIAARLQPRGFTGRYVATLPKGAVDTDHHAICLGTSSYGMAVFTKGAFVSGTDLDLNTYGADSKRQEPEDITSPCIQSYLQNRLTWSCSAHLYWEPESSGAALRNAEALKLAAKVKQWDDAGVPVVVGGDFNTQPWNGGTQPLYSPAAGSGGALGPGSGTMTEADETDADFFQQKCKDLQLTHCRSGATTYEDAGGKRKIDYLFFASRFFKDEKGDSQPRETTVSDHHVYRAAATWSDCGPAAPTAGGVFRVDATGALFRYAGNSDGTLAGACKTGFGWGNMRHIARQGGTLLAVDQSGDLWRYPADPVTGSYSGSTRTKAGSGLQGATALLAPGDLDGDGYPDLLVRDAAGDLWRYPGTAAGGYDSAAAVKAAAPAPGTSWGDYKALLAVDLVRDSANAADLVGRDTTGLLWLHKADGSGGYAPRAQIGNGWQTYTALATPGDLDGDGNADLIGRDHVLDKSYGNLWFYKGDGTGGYAPRVQIGNGYPDDEPLF
ncbi:endonuclease/exonuclease/phosphatase family protein [Streptomyces sp. NPDC059070]|uniref:endonuclease/exonuclease/phosphatase family protein n=1 Tax=Streptomyces sp. NPDC059070 TaxID=3346713 RepID=UPI0036C3EEA3